MKKDRNMYYQNYQAGGYMQPNNVFNGPQGFNQSASYAAYGPNAYPQQNGVVDNGYGMVDNNYETRISKLERQVRRLDTRVSKLESTSDIILEDSTINTNNYMI